LLVSGRVPPDFLPPLWPLLSPRTRGSCSRTPPRRHGTKPIGTALPLRRLGCGCRRRAGDARCPVGEADPARRMAIAGAVLELAMEQKMERSMGIHRPDPEHGQGERADAGEQGTHRQRSVGDAAVRRAPTGSLRGCRALRCLPGSLCTRFGVFEAGQESAPAIPDTASSCNANGSTAARRPTPRLRPSARQHGLFAEPAQVPSTRSVMPTRSKCSRSGTAPRRVVASACSPRGAPVIELR